MKIDSVPFCRRKGFSLMELLIVIAIVGTLLAILLPVLSQARDSARTAACADRLRQIGAGLMAYVNDHNGMFIPAASIGGAPQRFWFDELNP